MQQTQSPKAGERTQEAGHDFPAVRVEAETLSDGSLVYNLIIEATKLYCVNERAATKYAEAINSAITNAILGL